MPKKVKPLGLMYVDLSTIKPLTKNFKAHDIEGIAKSLMRFGILNAIGRDEISGENFDGNGRVEALQLLFARDPNKLPVGVTLEKGKWLVPVTTGIAFATEAERVAAAAALNRLNETGGYDAESQLAILQELATAGELDATGYDDTDIAELLAQMTFEEEPSDASDTGKKKGGIKVRESAQMSAMRQTQLAFTPDAYAAFLKLSVALSQKLGTTDVSATVMRAMELLAEKPHMFDPKLAPPVTDTGGVTSADVAKAAGKLGDKFTGEQNLIPTMCPNCGEEFSINPKLK